MTATSALPLTPPGCREGKGWLQSVSLRLLDTTAKALVAAPWLCVGGLLLVLAGPAHSLTPEEFAALEPEEALQLPAVEAISVFGWTKPEFLFVLENALIDLRYLYRTPTGRSSEALVAAVKAYQRDAGHHSTGTLLVNEFLDLIQRGNEFWQMPIVPGPVVVAPKGDLVSAEGTWVSSEMPEPNPIQTTAIRCYRTAGLCAMVTARLVTETDREGWYHSPIMDLTVDAHDWTIARWTDDRIEAERQSGPCVTYRLVIDLRDWLATMSSQSTGAERCRGEVAPARSYTLASGYEVAARYWEERRERAHRLRSQAFQALTEKLQGQRKDLR